LVEPAPDERDEPPFRGQDSGWFTLAVLVLGIENAWGRGNSGFPYRLAEDQRRWAVGLEVVAKSVEVAMDGRDCY
jgi:hypothetical protein